MLIERRRLHAAAPFFEQRWSLSGAGLRAALVIEPRWPSSSAGHRAALAIEQRWSQSGWHLHELAPRNKIRLETLFSRMPHAPVHAPVPFRDDEPPPRFPLFTGSRFKWEAGGL